VLPDGPDIEVAVDYGLTDVVVERYDAASGRLLADWCPPFDVYHLYYPSRRQPTAAFTVLVNALRYRG
jgi:DNA-binding transcriptional LysR family regulator